MPITIFLTVVLAIVAVALVTVILMQHSEGGGLGAGGSPTGLMSARGATNFLTRLTAFLATIFVALSIVLAALAAGTSSGRKIDTSLDRAVPVSPAAPVDPLANPAQLAVPNAAVPTAPVVPAPADPLGAPAKK